MPDRTGSTDRGVRSQVGRGLTTLLEAGGRKRAWFSASISVAVAGVVAAALGGVGAVGHDSVGGSSVAHHGVSSGSPSAARQSMVWGPAVRVGRPTPNHQTVMTHDGVATLMWEGRRGLRSVRALPGRLWRKEQAIPGSHRFSAILGAGVDRNRIVTLIWESEGRGGRFGINASRHRPGRGWSQPVLLATHVEEDLGLWWFDMAVGPSGAVVVAWMDADAGVMSVAYRPRNSGWSAAQAVPSVKWPMVPHVTVDARGLATLGYQGTDGRYRLMQRLGQGWREPVVLPARGPQTYDIDAGRRGEVVMAWRTRQGTLRTGRLASGTWSGQRLTGRLRVSDVVVEASSRGAATFVLNTGTFSRPREVLGLRQARGGTLRPPTVIAPVGAECSGVSLASNRHNRMLLAWITSRPPTSIYVADRGPTIDRWAEPIDLGDGGNAEPCYGQGVGIAADGSAVVSWSGSYTRPGSSAERGFWVRRGTSAD